MYSVALNGWVLDVQGWLRIGLGTLAGRRVAHRFLGRDPQGSSVFNRPQFPTRTLYSGRPCFLSMLIGGYGLLDRFGKGRMT